MPSKLLRYNTRPSKIPKSRWKGKGVYYKHSTTGKWTKWTRKADLKRGSKKVVGKGRYKHTHDKTTGRLARARIQKGTSRKRKTTKRRRR